MNNSVDSQKTVNHVWLMLKLTYGIVPIVAGLDKLGFYMITSWIQYLNPMIMSFIPLSDIQFMYAVGVIEIVAGVLVLSRWTKIGAYVVAVWLIVIALTLFAMYRFIDIGIRDVVMAVGAIALGMLTSCVKETTNATK